MKMKLAVAVLYMVPAVAAADCVEGLRPGTAQEQAFYEKISLELHKLIPSPPEGCRLSAGSKAGKMKSVCGSDKTGEFSVNASQTYFCVTKSTACPLTQS